MMNPDPPARCRCSSSPPLSRLLFGRRRLPLGFGKKKSKGSMPNPLGFWPAAVLITSVEVMETTAGATRDAMSANDGIATDVTAVLDDVVWMGADCAFDLRIRPRSALMTTPKTTDAMAIATVDRIRLVREFIGFAAPFAGWKTPTAVEVFAARVQPPSGPCDEPDDEMFR